MSLRYKRLGDLIDISKGKKHTPCENGKFAYINIDNLHNEAETLRTNDSGVFVNENDLIIAWDGANAGKVGVGLSGVIGSTLARMQIADHNVNPRFLFWYLESVNDLIKSQRTGATIPHVNGGALKDLQIPLPSLAEQKRIAALLDAADALRRKDQELLQQYDALAQAIFIDMFGDPVRNERGWEKVRLGELIAPNEKISYGIVQPGDQVLEGKPVIRVGDFRDLEIDKASIKCVDAAIEEKHKKTRLLGDEILIACVGSIGRIALVDSSLKGYNIVRATARVRVDDQKVNRKYLAFFLTQRAVQNYFLAETRTVSQPTLNISHIEQTLIMLPPIKEQMKFEAIKSTIDRSRNQVLAKSSDDLFQSLLQQSFRSASAG